MSTSADKASKQPFLPGVLVYGAIGIATMLVGRTIAGGSQEWRPPIVAVVAGVAIPVALYVALRRSRNWSRVFEALALLMMVVAVVRLWRGTIPPFPYGDGVSLADFLKAGYVFPRWLAGMAVTIWFYLGVWQCPPVTAVLPPGVQVPYVFASLLCAVVMGFGSVAILRRWPNRLAVVLPMLTPVWLLFSNGYLEYYPLMIGIWLASLLWLFERPLEERSPWAIGALVGFLPVLYVAFVPISVLIAAVVVIRRPDWTLRLLAASLAVFAIVVAVSTPGGMQKFLPSLFAEMIFGEQGIMFPRYRGHMAGPTSLVFAAPYTIGLEHLRDVVYMTFWGAGWAVMPLLAWGAASAVRTATKWRAAAMDSRVWLGVGLVGWHLYDIVFIVPKMGPAKDIDSFCPAYVMLAFAAGRLLDRAGFQRSRWFYLFLCAVVAIAVATSVYVAYLWLPRRP